MNETRLPKHGWMMLSIPPFTLLFITLLFGLYLGIISNGDPDFISNGINTYSWLIICFNHSLLMFILIKILKKHALKLVDIGWSIPKNEILNETLLGIAVAILLYFHNELIIDPLKSIVNDRAITIRFTFDIKSSINLPFLLVATTMPIVEETIYRGFAYRAFQNKYSTLFIIMIASILFGPLHFGQGLFGIFATMTFSLILFPIYLWRKNLLAVTIGHLLYNGLVLLFV